ncbi:phytanoyl-CoA dioxygenase family protein [Micromonospora sp. DT227]|uniref:phytanoyl-CoA dioxygenase family protein n=1 Tax=Micromonospora sp. DT227 TaxID=3393433 RepID=UPI003CE756EA
MSDDLTGADRDGPDIDFLRTHGFHVWRGLLDPAEVAALRDEVRTALQDNYDIRTTKSDRVTGTAGYYLPMMGRRTPLSRALLADRRLVGIAERLYGCEVVPKPAKGILYRDASPWHQDSVDPHLTAIKLVAYLEPLTGETGALQILPGTHRGEYARILADYRRRWPVADADLDEAVEAARWPGLTLETQPGDVIGFDVHLWHASLGGRDRLQWSVSYAATPTSAATRDSLRHYVASFLSVGHPFDSDAYPYFDPDWSRLPRSGFGVAMADLFPDRLEPRSSR